MVISVGFITLCINGAAVDIPAGMAFASLEHIFTFFHPPAADKISCNCFWADQRLRICHTCSANFSLIQLSGGMTSRCSQGKFSLRLLSSVYATAAKEQKASAIQPEIKPTTLFFSYFPLVLKEVSKLIMVLALFLPAESVRHNDIETLAHGILQRACPIHKRD